MNEIQSGTPEFNEQLDAQLTRRLQWVSQAVNLSEQPPDIGYVARIFTQTSLPYRNPPQGMQVWQRHNGNVTLTLRPHYSKTGEARYPYGVIPRLLLPWMTTEAVRTKSPELPLGESLSHFMRDLGMKPTGGVNGTIARLRDQMERLFMANFTITSEGDQRSSGGQLSIANHYDLWWRDVIPDQETIMPSFVRLTDDFFREITERPVPVDLKTLAHLRGVGSMALDVYSWLTYRNGYLRERSQITWSQLRWQFGSQSADTRSSRFKFRQDFMRALHSVIAVYPHARVDEFENGIILRPSNTHVPKRQAITATQPALEAGSSSDAGGANED